MRLYTVHLRRPVADAVRDFVLIKEGFCWPAALFTAFWAAATGMWLVAIALLAADVGIGMAAGALGFGPAGQVVATVLFGFAVGLFGNDIRRWTLSRRGFTHVGISSGVDAETAEVRFLQDSPDLLAEVAP